MSCTHAQRVSTARVLMCMAIPAVPAEVERERGTSRSSPVMKSCSCTQSGTAVVPELPSDAESVKLLKAIDTPIYV